MKRNVIRYDREGRTLRKVKAKQSVFRPTTKSKRTKITGLSCTSFSKPYLLFISGKLPSKRPRQRYLGAYATLGLATRRIRKLQAEGKHHPRCVFYVKNVAMKWEHVVGNRMNYPGLAKRALQKR